MSEDAFDALVVGGGPAGASAAALLAAAGWRVAVVEKQNYPRPKVCGEFISETTWPLLHRLGVGERLLAAAGPVVRRVGVFVADSEVAAPLASVDEGGGRAVARELLDAALLQRAAELGANVLQPWTLRAYEDRGESYDCRLQRLHGGEQRELRTRLLVAAHGSWQAGVLPTQAFRQRPRAADLIGFKAFFRDSRLAPDLMPLFAVPGGYGGMVRSGARLSLSCCLRRAVLEACRRRMPRASAGEAVQDYLASECRGVARALEGTTIDGGWLAAGPLRTGIRGFGEAGILAVGNAAAEAHPIIAEGISMAIQSASLLCEGVRARPPAAWSRARLAALRDDYAAAWRANFAARLHWSAALAHLFMAATPARLASGLLQHAPALLTAGSAWAGKARTLHATWN